MSFPARSLQNFAFVVTALALLGACGPKAPPHGGGPPPASVAVQEVQRRTIPVEFEYPAQTAGSREVEVRARVPGIIEKRNYSEGGVVQAGQSLFTLDQAPFQAALSRAEADVGAAEARLNAASRNAKRAKPLYEAHATSQKDYDDAISAEEVATADVKSARARLVEARLNLSYTRVESPVTGVTSRALKSEGSLVPGPDVLLTTVTQVNPLYVNFGLSEAEQAQFRRESEAGRLTLPKDGRFDVAVKLEDGTIYERIGKLAFTDVRLNTATGTSDARAEIPNPDGKLRPGQFVRAILRGAVRPDAIAVPQRAVVEGPQGKMVYLFGKDNKAEARPITVGDWTGADWIVTSGLNPGDKVIVDGLARIFFPGAPVQVAADAAGGTPAPGAATPAKAGVQSSGKK
jgi:membrane fusion protein (multidrug efflux system)